MHTSQNTHYCIDHKRLKLAIYITYFVVSVLQINMDAIDVYMNDMRSMDVISAQGASGLANWGFELTLIASLMLAFVGLNTSSVFY